MADDEVIDRAISSYRAILIAVAELPSRADVSDSPRQWNRLVDRLQREQLLLRDAPAGRAAISELMSDSRPVVRSWAAGHALFWDETAARRTLEALRDADDVGLTSISAKYTLIELDIGRLDPTWRP